MGIDVLVVDDAGLWNIGSKRLNPEGSSIGVDGLANARTELRTGHYNVVLIDPWVVAERLECSNDYHPVKVFMDEAKARGTKVVVATGSNGLEVPKKILDVHSYDGFFEKPYDEGALWVHLYTITKTPIPKGVAEFFRETGLMQK